MSWLILVDDGASRVLKRIQKGDRLRLVKVIDSMSESPFLGDIRKIVGEKNIWRKRVGSYRIFYELYEEKQIIHIFDIERRTTATY